MIFISDLTVQPIVIMPQESATEESVASTEAVSANKRRKTSHAAELPPGGHVFSTQMNLYGTAVAFPLAMVTSPGNAGPGRQVRAQGNTRTNGREGSGPRDQLSQQVQKVVEVISTGFHPRIVI